MVVEAHLAVPSERELGQAAAGLCVHDDALVSRPGRHEHEQLVRAELVPGPLGERDVA